MSLIGMFRSEAGIALSNLLIAFYTDILCNEIKIYWSIISALLSGKAGYSQALHHKLGLHSDFSNEKWDSP